MPRMSKSAAAPELPYLYSRSETRNYSYRRVLPQSIEQGFVGTIQCAWMNAPRYVAGATIKLSLNTSDFTTARQRWSSVHAQVEALLAQRRGLANGADVGDDLEFLPALKQSQIEQIARNIEVEVCRQHDRRWVNLVQSRPPKFVADPDRMTEEDFNWRQNVNNEFFDLERGLQIGRTALHALDYNSILNELAPAENFTLALRDNTAKALKKRGIQDDVETRLLAANGLMLPASHPDRQRLTIAVADALLRAHKLCVAKMLGELRTALPLDPESFQRPVSQKSKIYVSAALKNWLNATLPNKKTAADAAVYINRFIGLFGDLPINQIDDQKVADFRDLMTQFPQRVPNGLKDRSITDIINWAKESKAVTLSVQTVNNKALALLSTILSLPINARAMQSNPVFGQKLKVRAKDIKKRRPYSIEDIEKVLRLPYMQDASLIPEGASGKAAIWLPVLAMYTGARLEELGQIKVSNIVVEDLGMFIDFLGYSQDGEDIDLELKNDKSYRLIPIHKSIANSSFSDFVQSQKRSGHEYLFHELADYRDTRTHYFSKWWGRYAREFVNQDKSKTFHSFRHLFADNCRNAINDEELRQRLLGHKHTTTTAQYGLGYYRKTLIDAIHSIPFDPIKDFNINI